MIISSYRLVGLNKVDSKPDQYLQFDVTSAVKDVSQTTVPFLDAQTVAPSPATWLAGAGLYHRVRSKNSKPSTLSDGVSETMCPCENFLGPLVPKMNRSSNTMSLHSDIPVIIHYTICVG